MASKLNPENHSVNTSSGSSSSPRISFSFNFCQSDHHVQTYPSLPSTTPANSDDFEFSISSSCLTLEETSLADEIFSNGKIVALDMNTQHKKEHIDHFHFPGKQTNGEAEEEEPHESSDPPPSVSLAIPPNNNNDTLKEGKSKSKNMKKTFWGFRKSSSLNSTSSYGTRLCFFPLMVRSSSTGSPSSLSSPSSTTKCINMKPREIGSSVPKCHRTKPPLNSSSVSGSSLGLGLYTYSNGKNFLQVNPVLNVVCSGSLFSRRKSKNKIKPNGSSLY